MAIDHDGYDFGGSALHGDLEEGRFDQPLVVRRWFGLVGESHLIDETKGRPLSCRYTLADFADSATLNTQLEAIDDRQGQLTGTLELTGNIERTRPQCTFLGYDRGEMKYDPNSGWWIEGTLYWTQRIKS